ncbi:MAG: hypothetical protein ACJ79P_22225, partial [Myxococcales bacterium]
RSTARRITGRTPATHDVEREFPANAARSRSPVRPPGACSLGRRCMRLELSVINKSKTLILGVKVMAVHINRVLEV